MMSKTDYFEIRVVTRVGTRVGTREWGLRVGIR